MTDLFKAETRPRSVKQLYEDAAKELPPPSSVSASRSFSNSENGVMRSTSATGDFSETGATNAAGSDEYMCTPVFGKANRKMRTRIDAEIEIRLVSTPSIEN